MAIVKLTSSEKGVLFVDDDGNAFVTSREYLKNYLLGIGKTRFLLLTRLQHPVDVSKFKKSPVFGGDSSGLSDEAKKDAWSKNYKKDRETKRSHDVDVDV